MDSVYRFVLKEAQEELRLYIINMSDFCSRTLLALLALALLIVSSSCLSTYEASYSTNTTINGLAGSMVTHPTFPLGVIEAGSIIFINLTVPNPNGSFSRFGRIKHSLFYGANRSQIADFDRSLCRNSQDYSNYGCSYNYPIASSGLYYFRLDDPTFSQIARLSLKITVLDPSQETATLLQLTTANKNTFRSIFHLSEAQNVTMTLHPTTQAINGLRRIEVNLMNQNITTEQSSWTFDAGADLPFNISYDSTANKSTYEAQLPAGSYIINLKFFENVDRVTMTYQSDQYLCPYDAAYPDIHGTFLPCSNQSTPATTMPCSQSTVTEAPSELKISTQLFGVQDGTCLANSTSIPVFYLSKKVISSKVDELPLDGEGSSVNEENLLQVQMNQIEEGTTQVFGYCLSTTSQFVDQMVMAAVSNPFVYFFLNFVNFFTLSSHYILLNMPLPPKLAHHLSNFYPLVNRNIISRYASFGAHRWTPERVDRDRLVPLGLSTDIFSSQSQNLAMAVINIAVYGVCIFIVKSFRPDNLLRKLLFQPFYKILIGQYISLVLPLTSPWVFFIIGSYTSIPSLVNLSFQYWIFFFSLLLSIGYLFFIVCRSHSCRQSKNKQRNLTCDTHQNSKKARSKGQGEVKSNSPGPLRTKSFTSILKSLNPSHLEAWHVGLSNFVFPLTLVISKPQVSLIVLLIYCIIGVAIARFQRRYRVNRVILSLYYVVFHCCFLAFRFFAHYNSIVVWAQIISLFVLLIGSIHQIAFIVFLFSVTVYRHFKQPSQVSNTYLAQSRKIQSNGHRKPTHAATVRNNKVVSKGRKKTSAKSVTNVKRVDVGELKSSPKLKKIDNEADFQAADSLTRMKASPKAMKRVKTDRQQANKRGRLLIQTMDTEGH